MFFCFFSRVSTCGTGFIYTEMKKILHIVVLMLSICVLLNTSCKTITKTVVEHDTLTIETSKVEKVYQHDTITIDSTKEQIVTVYKYDTIGRPYEVTKVEYRNKYITEQGAMQTVEVHDTLYVSQGHATTDTTKEKKRSAVPGVLLALVIAGILIWVGAKTWKI